MDNFALVTPAPIAAVMTKNPEYEQQMSHGNLPAVRVLSLLTPGQAALFPRSRLLRRAQKIRFNTDEFSVR